MSSGDVRAAGGRRALRRLACVLLSLAVVTPLLPTASQAATAPVEAAFSVETLPADGETIPSDTAASADDAAAPAAADSEGYWMLGEGGTVYAFGGAEHHGDQSHTVTARGWAALIAHPRSGGYWLLAREGFLVEHGDVPDFPSIQPNDFFSDWVAGAATPTGKGLFLFADDGQVLTHGDAEHHGDMFGRPLNGKIIDAAVTPSGKGYWLLGSDGGIFGFGDAVFHGSIQEVVNDLIGVGFPAAQWLAEPIVGIVPSPAGLGYWLVAADGGVFSFGSRLPFRGSLPAVLGPGAQLAAAVNGMVAYGDGYLMLASDGGVFTFSDLAFLGSLGGQTLPKPITSITPVPGTLSLASAEGRVGTGGGTVTIDSPDPQLDGVEIEIPPGALRGTTTITVDLTPPAYGTPTEVLETSDAAYALLNGWTLESGMGANRHPTLAAMLAFGGKVVPFAVDVGPSGTSFATPATLRIPHENLGLDDDALIVALVESNGSWEAVPAEHKDGHLVLEVSHLSTFLLLDEKVRGQALAAAQGAVDRAGAFFGWFSSTEPLLRGTSILQHTAIAQTAERFAAELCRDDRSFTYSQLPGIWTVLADLATTGRSGARWTSAQQAALRSFLTSRYDDSIFDAVGGRRILLSELLTEAVDIMEGDIWQAMFLVHATLRADRSTTEVQLPIEEGLYHAQRAPRVPIVGTPGTHLGRIKAGLSRPDEFGGRYHLFGMMVYAFSQEAHYHYGGVTSLGPPADFSALMEEMFYTPDIVSEPEEYLLDLKGAQIGRDLFELWKSSVGQGDPSVYRAACGEEPPAKLTVELNGLPSSIQENTTELVSVRVNGGWVPDPGDGSARRYETTIRVSGRTRLVVDVPYSSPVSGLAVTPLFFGSAGTYDVEVIVRDDAGGEARAKERVVVQALPPNCEYVPQFGVGVVCASGVASTQGDWSLVYVDYDYRTTECFRDVVGSNAEWTRTHFGMFRVVNDIEAFRAEVDWFRWRWRFTSTCIQGWGWTVDNWNVKEIAVNVSQSYAGRTLTAIKNEIAGRSDCDIGEFTRFIGCFESGHGATGSVGTQQVFDDHRAWTER